MPLCIMDWNAISDSILSSKKENLEKANSTWRTGLKVCATNDTVLDCIEKIETRHTEVSDSRDTQTKNAEVLVEAISKSAIDACQFSGEYTRANVDEFSTACGDGLVKRAAGFLSLGHFTTAFNACVFEDPEAPTQAEVEKCKVDIDEELRNATTSSSEGARELADYKKEIRESYDKCAQTGADDGDVTGEQLKLCLAKLKVQIGSAEDRAVKAEGVLSSIGCATDDCTKNMFTDFIDKLSGTQCTSDENGLITKCETDITNSIFASKLKAQMEAAFDCTLGESDPGAEITSCALQVQTRFKELVEGGGRVEQATYTAYPGKAVKNNNLKNLKDTTLEVCMLECNKLPDCKGLDWRKSDKACMLSAMSMNEAIAAEVWTDDPRFEFHNKDFST